MKNELEQVLSLFIERYHLRDTDDSAGRNAILSAMRGELPIGELRRVLTEDYELYPQYRDRVMAILDSIKVTPPEAPASDDGEALETEPPADTIEIAAPRRTRRSRVEPTT